MHHVADKLIEEPFVGLNLAQHLLAKAEKKCSELRSAFLSKFLAASRARCAPEIFEALQPPAGQVWDRRSVGAGHP